MGITKIQTTLQSPLNLLNGLNIKQAFKFKTDKVQKASIELLFQMEVFCDLMDLLKKRI